METVPSVVGEYTIKGSIGRGAFSCVYLAYRNDTQEYFACKVVHKENLRIRNLDAKFENEVRILQQLHHENIAVLYDVEQDENNYYLFLEYCPNGELFQYIVSRERLDEHEAARFLFQILNTVKYFHGLGICHRDLKPENIMLDIDGNVKITDFGLSRFMDKDNQASTPCGSPCYASPECICGKPYNAKTSDTWSIGVILFAMLTGHLPWTKRNQKALFEQISKGEYNIPSYLSPDAKSLISGLLTVDPSRRLTIEAALHHPFLSRQTTNNSYSRGNILPQPSLKKVDRLFSSGDDGDDSYDDYLIQNDSCVFQPSTIHKLLCPQKPVRCIVRKMYVEAPALTILNCQIPTYVC